jgi:HEAT repeat protein
MGSGAAEAVPALREALKGNDVVLQFLAIRALRGIGPEGAPAIPELRRFLSVQTNIRYEAARALASIEQGKR